MKKFELEAKLIGAQNQLQSLHTKLDKERAELKALKDFYSSFDRGSSV